jgi:hypothetical protein
MKSFFENQTGSGLVGILVVIVIIAALIYGSSFFWPKNENSNLNEFDANLANNLANVDSPAGALDALDKAREDIADINERTEERNETIEVIDDSEQTTDDRKQATTAEARQAVDDKTQDIEDENGTIEVTSVKAGDNLVSPVVIEGEGLAIDNVLIVELRNAEHEAMVKESVSIKAAIGELGPFKITLDFDFDTTKEGYVAVYEQGADGAELNLVEISVKYNQMKF